MGEPTSVDAVTLQLLQGIKDEIKTDIQSVKTDLTDTVRQMVTKDVFELQQQHHAEQHATLRDEIQRLAGELAKQKAEADAAEVARKSSKRWLWTAVITIGCACLAFAGALIAAYINTHG